MIPAPPPTAGGGEASPPVAAGPILVVLGPTATGKSELAERLAPRLDGEIVGVDSMQVYRGLDAGTAKPSASARARIPHHLVDVVEPVREFNLGDYVRAAEGAVHEILRRGRLPILVGGTGMYLRGFLKGIDPAPPRDPRLRAALRTVAERRGSPHLGRLLRRLDPAAAAAIGPTDRLRLVRALERVLGAGHPAARGRWGGPDRWRTVKVGIRMAPADLRARIEARADAMFRAGLVEETRRLLQAGIPRDAAPMKALGYREAVRFLDGVLGLPETAAEVKRRTRQFARRQMTWFRREEGVRWFTAGPGGAAALWGDVENYVRLRLTRQEHAVRGGPGEWTTL